MRGLTIQRSLELNPFVIKKTESHLSLQSQEPLAPWTCPQRDTALNITERLNALEHNRHFSSKCMSRCECAHCAWLTRGLVGNAAKLQAPFTDCHGKEYPCNCIQNIFYEIILQSPLIEKFCHQTGRGGREKPH